jgi:hypothetical protein
VSGEKYIHIGRERRNMKTLLVGAAGMLALQVLLFLGYFAVRAVEESRAVAWVVWLVSAVLVSLFVFMAVKAVCHECLTFPMAAVCERRDDPVDVEMESNRIGGYIKVNLAMKSGTHRPTDFDGRNSRRALRNLRLG